MKRIIIRERTVIPPFGEPARDLRILNKPLWLLQRDLLSQYCRGALEVDALDEIPADSEELLVHRDNLFFNEHLIRAFIEQARATGHACQIAFSRDDRSITRHALHLQEGIRQLGNLYVADLFYYPQGVVEETQPLVIDTQPREMGYYHIPSYMANKGDLVFQVPLRAFLSIENWVHVFLANSPFGVFAMGRAHEQLVEDRWQEKVAVSLATIADKLNPFAPRWRNHFLASSRLVKIGKNCSIDPTAVIHGPTVIGNNVSIGAGVTITNSLIGDNVTIQQGAQVMLSVISDRCFLPWNAAIFMTTLMDNTMIAQLSCLQMCVVGRNTFIGAGNIFTDFHLLNRPLQTYHKRKNADRAILEEVGLPVIGSAVGHNVKIGSGFVFYPARMIGSNTTLIYAAADTVVGHNINAPLDTQPEQDDDNEATRTVYLWPHQIDEPTPGDPTKSPIEPFSLSSSNKPRF
jgi:UDP-N-acetylglucosamine diphosphorylase / glucose-1-phosphate thymidylyltransferase / UDP-N-acetylgalactosamine diphosphorylase / glucosamine-1-phosphate N-acetyltransferase / galactosamine-1-phosphate N-acetyltransferase